MKITFLGTGTSQGIPVIGCTCEVCTSLDFRDQRLRTSVHVTTDGPDPLSLVIDTGPDFRQQMLRANVRRLDAVLFTHQHKDHTAGLDDIRAYNYAQQQAIPVYAQRRVLDHLRGEFPYIFAEERYPGIPDITTHEIDRQPFEIAGHLIRPVEVLHYQLPVLGFRLGDFTYITDAKTMTEREREKVAGSRVIVLNALRQRDHLSHLTLDEAAAWLEAWQPERAYLTHLSHLMGSHRTVERLLPDFIRLAYDGLTVEV